jgi:glycosyltransferase involved in cell wall biosynthesis
MAPKVVLHILNGEVFSGVEQVVVTLCRHLDLERYRPHVVTLFDGFTAQRAKELGFSVDIVPMKSRWDLRPVQRIRSICKQANVKILHVHTIRSHLVGALAAQKLQIPVVVHIHSPAIQESERRIKNLWNAFVEARLQKRTAKYIIVANSLRKYMIEKGIPESKITALLNAIDVRGVVEASRPVGTQLSIHQRLNLDSDVKLIGMVALFRHRKGAQDLLQAVKILGRGPVPYRLVMIGDGEKLPGGGNYLDVLKQMTIELGISHQVIYVGFQENFSQWMAGLDIFVLPSRFGEGLPMVVLEAMALGIPVIATPVEGTAEVLTDKVSGLLPPVENPKALVDALNLLLADPEMGKRMAKEAERVVRKHHDAPVHAQKMMAIYDEMLQ